MKQQHTTDDVGGLLMNVIDTMLEGFQVISSDWRYLYVNETVAKQGRRTKEELIGKTMMECYPGIENTLVYTRCRECMETGMDAHFDNEFIFPEGAVGWFELFIHPTDRGIIILSIDITERKRVEHQLKEKVKQIDMLINSTIDREVHMGELKNEIQSLKLTVEEV